MKGMTCLLALGFIMLHFSASFAVAQDDYGKPYYLTGGEPVYALDKLPGSNTRRITTYLPITTLIFKDTHQPLETIIENISYSSCITQYGEHFLIPSNRISTTSFDTKFGKQTIIFQQPGYICPRTNHDCDDSTGIDINRGSVLELVDKGDDIVVLRGKLDDNSIEGVLRRNRFDEWEAKGILTDAAKNHPSYKILEKTELKSFNTSCNEEKKSVDLTRLRAEISAIASVGTGGLLSQLVKIFDLKFEITTAQEFETNNTTSSSYGGKGLATRFWHIKLEALNPEYIDNDSGPIKEYFIKAEIACQDTAEIFIKNISINNRKKNKGYLSHRDMYDKSGCGTLDDNGKLESDDKCLSVYHKNGERVFFTSINSPSAYDQALKIWGKQLNDSSEAAIFLSFFNASCPDKCKHGRHLRQDCNTLLGSRSDKPKP